MDYTKYSFDELVQRATALVQDAEGWGDAYTSSTGQTLIQLIAAITDQLHYMLERRTQENFLPTARLESSIHALAGMMAYRPRRVVSSSGYLSIQPVDFLGNPIQSVGAITIPRFTKITYGDETFVNLDDVLINAGQATPTVFEVIEGTTQVSTYDTTEVGSTLREENYILIEDYKTVEEFSLKVYTETEEFLDVTKPVDDTPAIGAISFASATDAVYDLRITNEGLMVILGDNKFGKKPTGTVTLEWVNSNGVNVNIINTGLTFRLESSSLTDDSVPPNNYDYKLINTTPIIGGIEFESPSDVRRKAPDYIRTADRAVTNKDYEFWAKKSGIGSIIDVKTYGQEELGINPQTINNVYLVYLTTEGTPLSFEDLNTFRTYINNYKMLTTHLVVSSAEIMPLQINLRLKRNPLLNISNSELYDIIKANLIDFFKYKEFSLGREVLHSELVEHFHNATIIRNGSEKRLTTFVTIDVHALKEFEALIETQSIDVEVLAPGTNGDMFTLNINGTPYTYEKQGGNSSADVAAALGALIDADDDVSATVDNTVITIETETPETTFTISNTGTTVKTNMPITQTIQLPPSILNNEDEDNLFVPGSIDIVDDSGAVLFTDDGAGNIATGTVSYVTGLVTIPMLDEGTYNIRYLQNTDQNIKANPNLAVTYSLPKTNYSDETELLSTIEII